ncbi:MAG: ABC transporter permease [Betaproteobacteria bacterium]|nr:ABC transporter permease [Betaproteobacteria bacterium]
MNRIPLRREAVLLPRLPRRLLPAWRALRHGALILAVALSPATYDRATRRAAAQALCAAAWQPLPGYVLACVLIGAVATRIVAITAASYGLSHLALEAVVRVFAVELVPLAAALFVALRVAPEAVLRLARLDGQGGGPALRQAAALVAGNALAVWVLAIVGGVAALVVAYPVVHGFSLWGLAAYARVIGQVFDPVLALGLGLKILFFGLAVAVAPTAAVLETGQRDAGSLQMRLMARLLLLLVLVEGASLALKRF